MDVSWNGLRKMTLAQLITVKGEFSEFIKLLGPPDSKSKLQIWYQRRLRHIDRELARRAKLVS